MDNLDLEFNALREIADVSTESVIIYSLRDKKLRYANNAAFELLGLHKDASRSEIEGIFESVAPQDKDYVKNQYSRITKKNLTAEVEFRLINHNGRDIFICCNAYLIADQSAIVVYIRDISKAKQHEDYLVEFGARKNTILDTLSHNISGALHLSKNLSVETEKYLKGVVDETLKNYLTLLNDNNEHCLEIIHDLLENEHKVSPKIFVKNSRIDIIETISIVHDEYRKSYRSRKFSFDDSGAPLFINADEVKLLQVVNNLMSNAIKFSSSSAPIVLRVIEDGKEVIVSVKDFGIGIPESLKPLIFEHEWNSGRTGLNGEKSRGLGLSLCKNLLGLMQGRIWFESKEGEGSIFYFSLPKD